MRSEVFRRALEAPDPTVETLGFAGFFGLPVGHRPHGTELTEAHLPVLLNPALTSTGHESPKAEADARIAARTLRAWGRFRQAAVSSFAFVEAAGPAYAAKLVKDALALGQQGGHARARAAHRGRHDGRGQGRDRGGGAEGDEPHHRPCAAGAAARPRRACDQQPA